MLSKMFQHRASRKQTHQGKYKGRKSKRHKRFVNPVRYNITYIWGLPSQEENPLV